MLTHNIPNIELMQSMADYGGLLWLSIIRKFYKYDELMVTIWDRKGSIIRIRY